MYQETRPIAEVVTGTGNGVGFKYYQPDSRSGTVTFNLAEPLTLSGNEVVSVTLQAADARATAEQYMDLADGFAIAAVGPVSHRDGGRIMAMSTQFVVQIDLWTSDTAIKPCPVEPVTIARCRPIEAGDLDGGMETNQTCDDRLAERFGALAALGDAPVCHLKWALIDLVLSGTDHDIERARNLGTSYVKFAGKRPDDDIPF